MRNVWKNIGWIVKTIVGSTIYAMGFACFLMPNEMSPGGISGLALVITEVLQFGSVGLWSILMNLPLFILGGMKIGRRFFTGSLLGMLLSSVMIDVFTWSGMFVLEPLLGMLYGGVICGLGLGMVFTAGTSTGGTDILARLLKLKYRNAPIGQISMSCDALVVVLTGLIYQDIHKALYTGIALFLSAKVMDAVIYSFDYSKVALIISSEYEAIAQAIGKKLDRGATFLHGEGSYSHQGTKVVLAAVKKQQLTELKELVMEIDPKAFVIVQEAHQVLGDGFSRYSKTSL